MQFLKVKVNMSSASPGKERDMSEPCNSPKPTTTDDNLSSMTRDISPPPLKRKRLAKEKSEKEEVPKLLVPNTLSMYHKDKRRAFYYNYSEETELSLITHKPGMFGTRELIDHGAPLDRLRANVAQVVRDGFKDIKSDGTGGFIVVDYLEDDPNLPPSKRKETTSKPQSETLCRCCLKVINESQVMNRRWRKVTGVRQVGLVKILEEDPIDYHGPKVNAFRHHGLLGPLKTSAREGCHLCSLLACDPSGAIKYDERSNTSYVLKVIYAEDHNEGPGVLVIEPKGYPSRASYLVYERAPRDVGGTLQHERTDADPVLNLGKQWLEKCLRDHEACRLSAAGLEKFIPTRLIKMQASGKSLQSVSLVLGRDLPAETEYLALSHCWGGAKIVTLTKANLETFQTDIPLSKLPQNFSDAAKVTSLLGYQYIWIDSLCIIQDSSEDWEKEAAKMGSVYRHAICTIAAAGAKNSDGGCFTSRSAFSFTPCQLISHTHDRPGVYAENWHREPMPLHTRAWVVQERALSKRTLNFGAEKLSWDCISATASELDPEMETTTYNTSLKRTFYELLNNHKLPDEDQRGRPDWVNAWWKLVGEYSSCNISFVSDKWPAIQGLATEVERERDQKLVHGLWSHNLTDELLWTISRPKKKRLTIGAPSWSWMSINGMVHRRRYNYKKEFRLDAIAALADSPKDKSSSTELVVTAHMLPLRWMTGVTEDGSTPSHSFVLIDNLPGEPYVKPKDWHGRWIPDTIADESWETWALQIVRSDLVQLKTRVGLVVRPVNEAKNIWERVGFYELNWRDESHRDESVKKRWFGLERTITLI